MEAGPTRSRCCHNLETIQLRIILLTPTRSSLLHLVLLITLLIIIATSPEFWSSSRFQPSKPVFGWVMGQQHPASPTPTVGMQSRCWAADWQRSTVNIIYFVHKKMHKMLLWSMWSPLIPEKQSRNFQPGLWCKNFEATETECLAHATQPGTHGTKPGGQWPWHFHTNTTHRPLFDSQIHLNPYILWVGWGNACCVLCRHYISQFFTNPAHKDMHFYSSVSVIILLSFLVSSLL